MSRSIICIFAWVAAFGIAHAQWTVTLDTQTIELNETAQSPIIKPITLRASGTIEGTKPDTIELKLDASSLLGRGEIELLTEQEISEPEFSGRSWLVPISVTGYQPGDEDTKIINVFVNGSNKSIPVRIDIKKSLNPFSWTVDYPGAEFALDPKSRGVEILVSVGNIEANNVRVGRSESIENATRQSIKGGWKLCRREQSSADPKEDCSPQKINAKTHQTLYLKPENHSDFIGKHSTKVLLIADEASAPTTLTLTLYGSTGGHKVWGVLVILFSVILSWFATTYGAFSLSRRRLNRSAQIAREKLDDLANRVGGLSTASEQNSSAINQRIATLLNVLNWETIKKEDDIVFRPNASAGLNTERAEARLKNASSRIRMLDLLIRYGYEELDRVAKLLKATKTSKHAEDLKASYSALESLAERKPVTGDTAVSEAEISNLLGQANNVVEGFKTKVKPRGVSMDQLSPKQDIFLSSVKAIDTELRHLGFALLSINFLVSATVGYFVLIDQNPGFGLFRDFVFCFLWGLGLPAVGSQLLQQTPMSIRTKLSLPA